MTQPESPLASGARQVGRSSPVSSPLMNAAAPMIAIPPPMPNAISGKPPANAMSTNTAAPNPMMIYRIVMNVCAQARSRPRAEVSIERGPDRLPLDPGAPDAAFADLELRDRLEKAIAQLPEHYRFLIAAHPCAVCSTTRSPRRSTFRSAP